jgi:methanethiol S-methyltransferase
MLISHIILAFYWILYCFLHSLLADLGFKKNMQVLLGKGFRYYRLGYTLFAFIGLGLIIWYQYQLPVIYIFEADTLLLAAGAIISVVGLIIMAACIKKYFLSLSGLLSLVQEKTKAQLMIGGLHRWVRHPLYLGTFMALWGGFLILPHLSILISNTIITVYTLIGIQLEEKKLVLEFGEQYREYKKAVPKLVPNLFKRKVSPDLP